jgi:hypothetical protein
MSPGSDTDPLLRAIATGDERCPDGRALARLGRIARGDAVAPRTDLAPAVLARLTDADRGFGADADAETRAERAARAADAIDAYVERGAVADPALARLGELVRSVAPPRRTDLTERVRAGLERSERGSERTFDGSARFRVWSAVIAGHLAALLFIAVFRGDHAAPQTAAPVDTAVAAVAAQLPQSTAPSWAALREIDGDLFQTRRDPRLRAALAHASGLDSGDAVPRMLGWIAARQRSDGRFSEHADDGSADRDRTTAVQAFALLALLGEAPDERGDTVRRGLDRLAADADAPGLAPTPAGLAALALTEGALLTRDPGRDRVAERALARIDHDGSAPGSLPGFAWLALETAQHGGLSVSRRQLERARAAYARRLPDAQAEADRIGLYAFVRCVNGYRARPGTVQLVRTLAARTPPANADAVQPLAWFFPALALREAGGEAWAGWAHALRLALVDTIAADGRVPATRVRYAPGPDGDLLATALTALVLQTPYRYLPLAR